MNPALIIQARMDSKRLPGKVLLEINSKPMLGYLLDRLRQSKMAKEIIIATSQEKSDEPIARYCQQNRVRCFRGPLEDVAGRFRDVIRAFGLESFIRICADSPLIDFRIIDQGVEVFKEEDCDIVTNVFRRTFPEGQSFEILRAKTFLKGYGRIKDKEDLEHVTQHFYKNKDRYKICNLQIKDFDYSNVNFSINTREDFDLFKKALDKMTRPFTDYSWEDLIEIYKGIKDED